MKDSYVAGEAKNSNIQSEKEGISGGHNPQALLQPNVQAGVEEVIDPSIYDRGIVRICSTDNPGSKTDPSRFLNVGNCGDVKISCWLDKNSVSDAIEASNLLGLNETLSEMEDRTIEYLQGKGELFDDKTASENINKLRQEANSLEKNGDETEGEVMLNKIEEIENMFVYNHHKAELLFLKGRVNEVIARLLYARERGEVVAKLNEDEAGVVPETGDECPNGFHSENEACVPDGVEGIPTVEDIAGVFSCADGFVLEEKTCVKKKAGEPESKIQVLNYSLKDNQIYLGENSLGYFIDSVTKYIERSNLRSSVIVGNYPNGVINITDNSVSKEIKYLNGKSFNELSSGTLQEETVGEVDSSGEDKETDESEEVNSCDACGNGLFNFCEVDECNAIADACWVDRGIIIDRCNSCKDIFVCDDYPDEGSCIDNVCLVDLKCAWNGRICVEKVEAPVGKSYKIINFKFMVRNATGTPKNIDKSGAVPVNANLVLFFEHDCDRLNITYGEIDDEKKRIFEIELSGFIEIKGLIQGERYIATARCLNETAPGRYEPRGGMIQDNIGIDIEYTEPIP